MNFTREPLIETIISPKDGCKLLVRSSRGGEHAEDYYVDAIEVVSLGHAFFFRSMERPKAFLVPVSDYEVLEVKEPRVALKTPSHDRNIKIGGGREASLRQGQKEPVIDSESDSVIVADDNGGSSSTEEETDQPGSNPRSDKRRDRRRRRHRRSSDDQEWNARRPGQQNASETPQVAESASKAQGGGVEDEMKVSSPILPTLIPPPTTLISQTLSRYKGKEFMEDSSLNQEVKPEKKAEEPSSVDVAPPSTTPSDSGELSPTTETERNSYLF